MKAFEIKRRRSRRINVGSVPVEAAGENITVEQGSFPLDGRLPDESENIVAEENASDVGENAAFAEGVAPVPPVPPAKPAAPVENEQPRKAKKIGRAHV